MILFFRALLKFVAGFAMLAALLFVPAGTWQFYQAWVMLGVLFVPMAIMGAVMLVKNPELLSKRLNAKEKEQEQKWVVALSGLLFVANSVINDGSGTVEVLECTESWHGITYREDMPAVKQAIAEMRENGLYPETLLD